MRILEKVWGRLRGARSLEWIALLVGAAVLAMLFLPAERTQTQEDGTCTELERRMERVLSAIEGAGSVRVLVNEEEAAQTVFQSADGGGGARTRALGVLVVAEGAGNLRVRLALIQAVQALLNIDAERIEVLAMEGM